MRITLAQIELWFHRYGSEAPEHVFRAAYMVWRSILADNKSPGALRHHDRLVREFVGAGRM